MPAGPGIFGLRLLAGNLPCPPFHVSIDDPASRDNALVFALSGYIDQSFEGKALFKADPDKGIQATRPSMSFQFRMHGENIQSIRKGAEKKATQGSGVGPCNTDNFIKSGKGCRDLEDIKAFSPHLRKER